MTMATTSLDTAGWRILNRLFYRGAVSFDGRSYYLPAVRVLREEDAGREDVARLEDFGLVATFIGRAPVSMNDITQAFGHSGAVGQRLVGIALGLTAHGKRLVCTDRFNQVICMLGGAVSQRGKTVKAVKVGAEVGDDVLAAMESCRLIVAHDPDGGPITLQRLHVPPTTVLDLTSAGRNRYPRG